MAPPNQNRHNKGGKRSNQQADSVIGQGTTKIRKRIRDIERLLEKKKDVLPSNIKLEKQRELKALNVELQNAQALNKVKTLSKKYQMVRFFERKKATKRYKQIKKEYDDLVANGDADKKEIKKLRKKLTHQEIDLAYVVNFPRDRKYIALYPNEDPDVDMKDENVKKGLLKSEELRNEFKREVEKMLKDGLLPVSVEEILEGKSLPMEAKRIEVIPDAPEEQAAEDEEEDDFFE